MNNSNKQEKLRWEEKNHPGVWYTNNIYQGSDTPQWYITDNPHWYDDIIYIIDDDKAKLRKLQYIKN